MPDRLHFALIRASASPVEARVWPTITEPSAETPRAALGPVDTGAPKGAALTHRALVGQTATAALWPAQLRRDEVVAAANLGDEPIDVALDGQAACRGERRRAAAAEGCQEHERERHGEAERAPRTERPARESGHAGSPRRRDGGAGAQAADRIARSHGAARRQRRADLAFNRALKRSAPARARTLPPHSPIGS